MEFVVPEHHTLFSKIERLQEDSIPQWGSMSAQRMIEHLTDSVRLSYLPHSFPQTVPEEKVEKAQAFLASDHPMPRNFQVAFATPEMPLRHTSLKESIAELSEEWQKCTHWWDAHPDALHLHPSFGILNRNQWMRVHSKHFTHHFGQFSL